MAFLSLAATLALRAPRPEDDLSGVRDAVGDHGGTLSGGHSALGEGAGGCVYCHFEHGLEARRPLWRKGGEVDAAAFARESLRAGGVKTGLCLSCHDGTVAAALKAHAASPGSARQPHQAADLGSSHPVGVDYGAALRRDPDAYNDPALDARVVLEEGKVGCVSCHAAHDRGAGSAGSVRPDVCTDCHRR